VVLANGERIYLILILPQRPNDISSFQRIFDKLLF
jgi:hypothetical protein